MCLLLLTDLRSYVFYEWETVDQVLSDTFSEKFSDVFSEKFRNAFFGLLMFHPDKADKEEFFMYQSSFHKLNYLTILQLPFFWNQFTWSNLKSIFSHENVELAQ